MDPTFLAIQTGDVMGPLHTINGASDTTEAGHYAKIAALPADQGLLPCLDYFFEFPSGS